MFTDGVEDLLCLISLDHQSNERKGFVRDLKVFMDKPVEGFLNDLRLDPGTDGLSHVEDIVLDAKSVMEKVASAEVRVGEPGRFSDWHVGPQRQYIINLSGSGQLEVAEGKVDLPPGSMEYIDDLTGKGHTTRTTSKEERVSIWLKFEDQKQRIGPLNPKTTTSPKP